MTDNVELDGPFTVDHEPDIAEITRKIDEALGMGLDLALRNHVNPQNAPFEGANVYERSAVSTAVQSSWNAAVARKWHPFNIIDGWAHAIAVTLAQMPAPARDAALQLIVSNIRGYELRTRGALKRPGGLPT